MGLLRTRSWIYGEGRGEMGKGGVEKGNGRKGQKGKVINAVALEL